MRRRLPDHCRYSNKRIVNGIMNKRLRFQISKMAHARAPVVHLFAIAVFLFAQLAFSAHAVADPGDIQDHDINTCQLCHIAERDGDLAAPDAAFCSTPFEALSLVEIAQSHFVFEDRIFTANSRAPPTI